MADKEKRVGASRKKAAPTPEQPLRPVPAELSFDAVGNRWVLQYLIENKGLTLKMLVKPAGVEDAYEYEIWQGADRVLSSNDNEWQYRMHHDFSDCIKVFDGIRQRWLLQKKAPAPSGVAVLPYAE